MLNVQVNTNVVDVNEAPSVIIAASNILMQSKTLDEAFQVLDLRFGGDIHWRVTRGGNHIALNYSFADGKNEWVRTIFVTEA